jgi:hypothetical protein
MLLVGVGHERGQALVQPEMIPIAARDAVAPPLVRELVRLEPDVVRIGQQRATVVRAQQREHRGFLLDASGRQNLCVGRPWIPHAGAVTRENVRMSGVSRKMDAVRRPKYDAPR